MNHENQEYNYRTNNTPGVLLGVLVGGLAGAVTMLLLAPQSGKDTRVQIQKKGIELRDKTTEVVGDTMTQVRAKANELATGGREAIKELTKQGQKVTVEQLDRVSDVVEAGKAAVNKV